jgi:hypothetical protein
VARNYNLWFKTTLAYTIAGAFSSVLVGLVLGATGKVIGLGGAAIALYSVGILSLILAGREWGWINFRLPERKLQTEKVWAHDFGFVMASAMWGLHIGLGFATRITYGGFWVLVAVILVLGDVRFGAIVMLCYWVGRALPLWLAPLLLSKEETANLSESIFDHRLVFHRVSGIGLVWSAGLTILLAASN